MSRAEEILKQELGIKKSNSILSKLMWKKHRKALLTAMEIYKYEVILTIEEYKEKHFYCNDELDSVMRCNSQCDKCKTIGRDEDSIRNTVK